jgi:glycosyltransferase involved in cell wall biosynthesis
LRGSVVIPTSDFLVHHLHKHYNTYKKQMTLVVLGIDTEYFDPANVPPEEKAVRNAPLIVMPARFTAIKGHRLLLDALHILQQQNEKFQCVLMGPIAEAESYVASLKELITQLGLGSCVRIEDAQPDVRILMNAADIVVAPSIHPESFGCVVAEACALEKCVVASDLGGFRDILRHQETGWLFSPLEASCLAETLLHVLYLPQKERKRIGQMARQRVCTHFSLDRYVREIVGVYRTLITANKNKHACPCH